MAFLLRPWVWPDAQQFVLLIIMGVLSALASAGFILAYRHAEANFVAPFEYTALLWAVTNGVVFFGDFPDSTTWAGRCHRGERRRLDAVAGQRTRQPSIENNSKRFPHCCVACAAQTAR
jgi:hypothetical protein